jgi:hypothetical protein
MDAQGRSFATGSHDTSTRAVGLATAAEILRDPYATAYTLGCLGLIFAQALIAARPGTPVAEFTRATLADRQATADDLRAAGCALLAALWTAPVGDDHADIVLDQVHGLRPLPREAGP